jgi:hypothetical protein
MSIGPLNEGNSSPIHYDQLDVEGHPVRVAYSRNGTLEPVRPAR